MKESRKLLFIQNYYNLQQLKIRIQKLDIKDFKFRLKYEMYEIFPMRKFPEYFSEFDIG